VATVAQLTRTVAHVPWRLPNTSVELWAAAALTASSLLVVGFLTGTLTGFTTPWTAVGSSILVAVVALAFQGAAPLGAGRGSRGRLLVAAVGPLIPGGLIVLGILAYLGPLGFWYWFWTFPVFRVVYLTTLFATIFWTAYVMAAVRAPDGWHAAFGGPLAAMGAGLVAVTALLPHWTVALRSLDRPLNLAPATDTMLFALETYAGVNLDVHTVSYAFGGVLLACGYSMWLRPGGRAGKVP
jgi:hypothetical protein